MDGIVKAVVALVVGLVVLRMLAQMLVGLTDVSTIGCVPSGGSGGRALTRLADFG